MQCFFNQLLSNDFWSNLVQVYNHYKERIKMQVSFHPHFFHDLQKKNIIICLLLFLQ